MFLCDGNQKARKNRAFLLNPDVKMAAFASTEIPPTSAAAKHAGPVGVLSLLSHFYPTLKKSVIVELQGPVEKRRRPMPAEFNEVLKAIPSDEACDVALAALQKGKHLRLEYTPNSVIITVTDRAGAKQISRLKWK